MKRGKRTIKEGDVFLVPLIESPKYAIGVAARSSRGIVLGYFFAPPLDSIPSMDIAESLAPDETIATKMFGDPGLLKKQWPVLGKHPNWDRSEWPIPVFLRTDDISGRHSFVYYEDDLLDWKIAAAELSSQVDVERYPRDSLAGCVALQIVLTKVLLRGE